MFAPKVVVILGYGNAVGEGILEGFAAKGYSAAICARNLPRLTTAAGNIRWDGAVRGLSKAGRICGGPAPDSDPSLPPACVFKRVHVHRLGGKHGDAWVRAAALSVGSMMAVLEHAPSVIPLQRASRPRATPSSLMRLT